MELSATEPEGRRKRAVTQAIVAVSEHLGNTPAVARGSYLHPKLVEAYLDGQELAAEVVAQVPEGQEQPDISQWEQAFLAFLTR